MKNTVYRAYLQDVQFALNGVYDILDDFEGPITDFYPQLLDIFYYCFDKLDPVIRRLEQEEENISRKELIYDNYDVEDAVLDETDKEKTTNIRLYGKYPYYYDIAFEPVLDDNKEVLTHEAFDDYDELRDEDIFSRKRLEEEIFSLCLRNEKVQWIANVCWLMAYDLDRYVINLKYYFPFMLKYDMPEFLDTIRKVIEACIMDLNLINDPDYEEDAYGFY